MFLAQCINEVYRQTLPAQRDEEKIYLLVLVMMGPLALWEVPSPHQGRIDWDRSAVG